MYITTDILSFIRQHPEGTRRQDIAEAFPLVGLATIDGNLARLRNHGLIYNNGVIGAKGSTWFPKTHEGVKSPFPEIAADIVAELRNVHREGQELHLARRLQEIFGEKG